MKPWLWRALNRPLAVSVQLCKNIAPDMSTSLANLTNSFLFAGTYDCIELSMIVYQEYQPYVTEIFVPSSLIVMAAWMTFWVDKNSIPARVSLGGLCVIASITHSVGLVLGLRHNIEWNSVNIWLNTCIIFVIAALLEYGIVHSLARRANKMAQSGSSRSSSESSSSDQVNCPRQIDHSDSLSK